MATTTAPAPITEPPVLEHPLRNPNFRVWILGGTISLLGDQFYMVALPWLVLLQTGSAAAMGTVMMAGAIPRALLMLMGGAMSDRFSARRIMIVTAIARTVCVTVAGALVLRGAMSMPELYALAIVFGFADAFAVPAQSAFLPSIVSKDQMVAASSVSQGTAQLTTIVGPAPAGLMIKLLGVASAFFVDAVSFLFIIGALWKLPDPPIQRGERKRMLDSIAEGFRYVLKDVPLTYFMLLAAVMNFCLSGPIGIGLMYLTKTRFGSPAVYGAVMSALAAGGLLGAVLAGVWKVRRRGIMILVLLPVLAVCLGLIGLMESSWSTGLVMFVMGVTSGLVNVHIGAWVMARIDVEVRGRVSSLLMLCAVGLAPVSLALAGFMIAWNLKLTFLIAAGAMLVAVSLAALQKPVREIA